MLIHINKKIGNDIFKGVYLAKDITPQMLAGGNEQRGKKSIWIPGLLENYNYIAFGEAKDMISTNDRYGNFQSLILHLFMILRR